LRPRREKDRERGKKGKKEIKTLLSNPPSVFNKNSILRGGRRGGRESESERDGEQKFLTCMRPPSSGSQRKTKGYPTVCLPQMGLTLLKCGK